MITFRQSVLRGALALGVLGATMLAPVACGTVADSGTVTILGSWTGAEEAQFRQVLDRSGIKYSYQGTRGLDQVLQADVHNGNPPDIAILPSPGALATYVGDRELKPIGAASSAGDYDQQWQQLTTVNGRGYAVVVKADLKSVLWFDPAQLKKFGQKPNTWAQLVALSTKISKAGGNPWCLGVSSDATSGWPGTDWIEDIVLHEFGPAFYQQWADGGQRWTDPRIKQAWQQWGSLVAAAGTPALFTDFSAAGKGMFDPQPDCYLDHEASFIITSYLGYPSHPQPGSGFNFVQFPVMNPDVGEPTEVSADLAGMFHDTPAAQQLMSYLASDAAQRIWPSIAGSGAFSVDKRVGPGAGANRVTKDVSQLLTTGGGNKLCFDASDLMPSELSAAFNQAVLEYLADPAELDDLLKQLDILRLSAYKTPPPDAACGQAAN
jgi:alpha-glucoside transport system substrate-binding protein